MSTKLIVPADKLAELRAERDKLAAIYSDVQILQAEFNLARAKLDKRQREILVAIGVGPNATFDEDTGEITGTAPKG